MEYFKLLRPHQWLKNFFIFAPVFFAGEIMDWNTTRKICLAFVVFCVLASSVYIINDIADRKNDRLHPRKKTRPIASGRIAVDSALFFSGLLLLMGGWLTYNWIPEILSFLIVYLVLNFFYSAFLKNVVVLDILSISSFYLLRILIGGAAGNIRISLWMILCVFFLTLFIVIGKRKSEFNLDGPREVLHYYSISMLNRFLQLSAALTLAFYTLYLIFGPLSVWSVFSILFVCCGLLRYLHIIHHTQRAECPERLILQDKILFISLFFWSGFMFIMIYHY